MKADTRLLPLVTVGSRKESMCFSKSILQVQTHVGTRFQLTSADPHWYQVPDLAMVALRQLVTHTFPAHISSPLLVFPAPPKEITLSWTFATGPTSRETESGHRMLYVTEIKADLQKPGQVSTTSWTLQGGRRTPVSLWPPLTGAAEVKAGFDLDFYDLELSQKRLSQYSSRRGAPGSQMKIGESPGTNAFCLGRANKCSTGWASQKAESYQTREACSFCLSDMNCGWRLSCGTKLRVLGWLLTN